ncbi:hypothetical protein S140_88 [Shewanella sp. phage 1/40]|uniref:hypothetical protein n=1 Tax=Shewanella sp. phage 1/40 TaxID=1458860 RepID=UPI0004F63A16|nr:hypothetical protein S140_88 [Shewanella sp. phage 1/40]AHK11495.1 hypothetical protein S140_88 [Shewanella sp. phage 1/40]
MAVSIVLVAMIGWLIGVWVPWWVVAAMWCGYGINLCLGKQSGLDGVIGSFLWGIILITATVSGYIFGDVTFAMIWDWLVMVFTGGK